MTNYVEVLLRRHQGRQWILNGDDYDNIVILDGQIKPSKESLDDAWPEVEQEIAAERQAKIETRNAALAKLAALGLTDAEIKALVG